MKSAKKNWLLAALCLCISISFLTGSGLFAAERPPIKVGLLLPYTGNVPFQTKGVNDGVELYFSEIGQKAGGRAIQVVKEDDENNPTVALTKARRLVEQQKVHFIVGTVNSGVALAIHDYLRKQNVIQINPCAFTRELTSPQKASPNIFRVVEAPSGRLAFDQYNQRIVGVYVVKVEKREGRIENVVIDRIGKVAQADVWKWWNK